ncbi:hypothetical protein DL96DRAFT_148792 [Flagelloscypha sp. PMI_526]|nr:hypothetical protein DL96DRAFT_148792 [Flagelloscypha sp. PMI_526]
MLSLLMRLSSSLKFDASCDIFHSHSYPNGHINCLPVEILGEIFAQASAPIDAAQSVYDDLPTTKFSFNHSPLNVTHVSRHWRAVALQTPRLWSTVHMQGCRQYHPFLLEEFLHRSGKRPLTLSLRTERRCRTHKDKDFYLDPDGNCPCRPHCPLHHERQVQALFEVLVLYASRWEQVTFITSMHHPTALFSLQPGDLTMLKSANIFPPRTDSYSSTEEELIIDNQEVAWNLASSSAKLQSLTLSNKIPSYHRVFFQLSQLNLDHVDDLSFLIHFPNLTSLSIIGRSPCLLHPLVLPHLTSLQIDGFESLDSFTLPSLRSLKAEAVEIIPTLTLLLDCLKRSSNTSLHTLHLDCFDSPSAQNFLLNDFFSQNELSLIKTLRLCRPEVTSMVLTGLHALLPHLEQFTVYCGDEVTESDLVEFVINRPCVGKLKELTVFLENDETMNVLQGMGSENLDIAVYVSSAPDEMIV